MQSNAINLSVQNVNPAPVNRAEGREQPPQATPAVSQPERSAPDAKAIEQITSALAEHNIDLRFSTDEATHTVVVQLVDKVTGEPIRQIPTEVSLRLAANFKKLNEIFLSEYR